MDATNQDLRETLERLKEERREVDSDLDALRRSRPVNQMRIWRLRLRRQRLAQQIRDIENRLTPDIIA